MINVSIFVLFCAMFVVIGVIALSTTNEVISTRHKATQLFMILIVIGGLVGIEGSYKLGITISVLATLAYVVRWYKFKKDQRYYCAIGRSLPECKKP